MLDKVKIAVVDDEEEVGIIYKAMLKNEIKSNMCIFSFFNSASDYLNFIQSPENDTEHMIVISDINMPEMDGFTLLGKVQNEFPHIDLYISSAYGNRETKERSSQYNIKGFFEKPVDFSEIKKAVEKKFMSKEKQAS